MIPEELKPYFAAVDAAKSNVASVNAEIAAAQAVLDAAGAKLAEANRQYDECKQTLVTAVKSHYGS